MRHYTPGIVCVEGHGSIRLQEFWLVYFATFIVMMLWIDGGWVNEQLIWM